jgi:hypothetical protein
MNADDTQTPEEAIHIMLPASLALELKIRSATEGVSKRYLVLKALQAAGFAVAEDELRPSRRRSG